MNEDTDLFANRNDLSGLPKARARFLVQAIQLEEDGLSSTIGWAIGLIAGLFVFAVIWSAITPVVETAGAFGEVVPSGQIQEVKHLNGGVVDRLNASNGLYVTRGDLLLTFAPLTSAADLERMLARRAALELKIERLQAQVEDREPNFAAEEKYAGLVQTERTIYQAQIKSQSGELSVLDSQISQRTQELAARRRAVVSLGEELEIARGQAEIREQLVERGGVSRADLLATQSKVAEAQSRLRAAEDAVSVARSALAEAEQRRSGTIARFVKEAELEAGESVAEVAEVSHQIISLENQVDSLELRAPLDGIVQDMTITSVGAVITAGEPILTIVPVNDELIVQARIRPEDIGHVHIGDSADVRVTSYDSARFGSVDGSIEQLSASTQLDAEGTPYYRAEIKLAQPYVGRERDALRILPGMQVEARVRTGEKTILQYLMLPVTRGFAEAFTER